MTVIKFPKKPTNKEETKTEDTPVSEVIERVSKTNLKSLIVIGEHEDGSLYFETSYEYVPDTTFMLDTAKNIFMMDPSDRVLDEVDADE